MYYFLSYMEIILYILYKLPFFLVFFYPIREFSAPYMNSFNFLIVARINNNIFFARNKQLIHIRVKHIILNKVENYIKDKAKSPLILFLNPFYPDQIKFFVKSFLNSFLHKFTAVLDTSNPMYFLYFAKLSWFPSPVPHSITNSIELLCTN